MKAILSVVLGVLASGATAQDRVLAFDLGVGAQSAPDYFGSDDVTTGVTGSFGLNRLVFGGLSLGGGDLDGLGVKAGLRYIGERSADDHPELTGLTDVEQSLELGGGLAYTQEPDGINQTFGSYSFAEIRYGVVGHESLVAEFGVDLIYKPSAPWEFRAGSRLFAGDDDYAATYFSDARVGYEASGGIVSRGIVLSAGYDFNDTWGVVGSADYTQLVDDAAASPIVQAGSEDQVSVSLIVTRAFAFQF